MQIAYRAKYPQLICVVLFLCIVPNAARTFNDINLHICNSSNYTSSKLESNLNAVLNTLVNNTSSSNGFNTSVSGRTPERVYGLLQCWGDATKEECFNCSKLARTRVRQDCGNAIGGRAWLPKCFIRYENYSFIGILDTNTRPAYNVEKVEIDPAEFATAVKALFTKLSNEALRSARRYSSGSTTTTSYPIYSLVQCWSDLTSVEDCKTCLRNAIFQVLNVTGNGTHFGGEAASGSCVARYELYTFFNPASPPPQPPLQLPSPPSPPTHKKFSNKIGIILGILGGFLVMLLLCLFAIRRKLKSAVLWKPLSRKEENSDTEVYSAISEEHGMVFNLPNIKAATRNFHDDNKLGEGGFGSVYKGIMLNGKQIAVKKLSLQSCQGKREFVNEVKLVAKIQHRNLVKLLGCCTEQSERLLVYEFLVNNSLDKILFHPQRSKELDWPTRYNIIRGVARGLLYLHQDSHLRIIHRDIKTSNILLDEKMEAKISDFGLARLIHQDESHVETRVVGTYGYMAPEYAMLGQLSAKADVYSFGVVILEIICGRKNTDNRLAPKFQSVIEWVWRSYEEGNMMDVIDKEIIESLSNEQVSRCIYVALLCTQADATNRPPMTSVYEMISNPSMTNLPNPTNPAYFTTTQNDVPSYTSTSVSIVVSTSPISSDTYFVPPSINHASISDFGPR